MPIMGDMIFEDYRADMVLRGIKPHSFTAYDRAVKLWLAYLGDRGIRPEDARRSDVQAFLVSTGWAPSTMRTARSYLSAAYAYALEETRAIERNPVHRVRLPKAAQHVPITVPPERLRALLADARDPDDDLLLRIFAFTGLRTIEVRRLTWNDVSLADGTLHVHGKGDRWRMVPIHPRLRTALVGRTWAGAALPVVPGRQGATITPAGLHYRMERVAPDVLNHSWRRTVATSLRANGCDPSVRDAIMGWTRDSIFDRHYNAVSPRELQDGIRRLYADDPC